MAIPSIALIPSGYKANKVYSVLPTDGTGDFTFTRASSATRIAKSGLRETVATGIPRLDHTGGGCASLLIEPQSTNLWENSEYSDQSYTTPLGVYGFKDITSAEASNDISLQNKTVSIFLLVKKSDNSIPIFESSSTSNADVVVRLGGSSAYSSSFVLTDLGNGFYLAKLENQLVTSSGTDTRFSNNSGVATYISTIQLEESTACTSYIPTSGAIATRLADVATLDLTPFAVTSIIETIGGVDQTPITTIPSSYTIPQGNINKIIIE
tara:strand:- start:10 stop:810 length:801 start_codon:yes stop_codon:yes gene_type:complete